MRTEDHFFLTTYITRNSGIKTWQRNLFLLGNILPDYNRLTYLGPRSQFFSHGHSFKAQRRKIERFFRRPYRNTPLWWYRTGKIFHYVTDSFTRPHNPEFCYNSPSHIAYELRLQEVFDRELTGRRWKIPAVTGDPYYWLFRRHAYYMKHSRDIPEDCEYICTTIPALWKWVYANKIEPGKRK